MLTERQIDGLNLIRWTSALAIVICHFLQGYDNTWAWVLNIGVQVFFFMSGFLYGVKRISNIRSFYKGRLIKIYLPFALWVSVASVILYLVSPNDVDVRRMFYQYATLYTLPGLSHLWFMEVLFFCYLLLPMIDRCISKSPVISILILFLCFGLVLSLVYYSKFLWVALYYIGYLCGRYARIQKYLLIVSVSVCLWILTYLNFTLSDFREESVTNNILHAAAGILIFTGLYLGSQQFSFNPKFSRILKMRGAYELYLTHFLFILGPVSLLFITDYSTVNIMLISIVTFACSFGLLKTSDLIKKYISKLKFRLCET